jgi:hypothetical protein
MIFSIFILFQSSGNYIIYKIEIKTHIYINAVYRQTIERDKRRNATEST